MEDRRPYSVYPSDLSLLTAFRRPQKYLVDEGYCLAPCRGSSRIG